MRLRNAKSAFSLVEVIIAVGILALSVTALLGLLTSIQKKSNEANERLDAVLATDTAVAILRAEGAANISAHAVAPGARSSASQRLHLSRDCSKWGWGSSSTLPNPFYAVTIEQLTEINDADPNASFAIVAVTLRVEWPVAVLDSSSPGELAVMRTNFVFPQ